MHTVLLLNPNTSSATTERMAAAARKVLPPGFSLRGVTAARGAAMIVDAAALALSEQEVVRIGLAEAGGVDGIIVAAFGDPGVQALRTVLQVPVIGIGEAALREAAGQGRRFGIATTTGGLRAAIEAKVRGLLPGAAFTGVRITDEGDPAALAADPERQFAGLFRAVMECIERDGAERVVIGGGPLTDAAAQLRRSLGSVIVEPVPAAVRMLVRIVSEG